MKKVHTIRAKETNGTSVQGTKLYYDIVVCGKRIQQLRKAVGYTQEALADRLGIDRSFLSRIEAGKKGCSVDMFITLASVFGTSLDHLILGKSSENGLLKQEIRDLIQQLTTLEERL